MELNQNSIDTDDDVALAERTTIKKPNLYQVLIHNDDYTTMDFVVMVLTDIFHKSIDDATQIMLNVHHSGVGVAGIYTREICESKIEAVHALAEEQQYPLLCTMERV